MKRRSIPHVHVPGQNSIGCVIPFPKVEYELTKEQARILKRQIEPIDRYFRVLYARAARKKAFPKLLTSIERIQSELHALNVHLHYEESGWSYREDAVKPPE